MDIITAFETIRADLSGLQALATLFTDTFADTTDEKVLLQTISLRKTTYLNSAMLLVDLLQRIGKDMDAAIDAGMQQIEQNA